MWFHTIEYGSNPLSNSHVDKKMVVMLSKVAQYDNIESEINAKQDIIEIIRGRGMSCNTSWCLVDFVLLPTWLPEEKHWLLATLSFDDRAIHVCNTLANDDAELIVKKALLPFCKLLPHYLLLTEFYEKSDIDFTSKFYYEKSKTDCFSESECVDHVAGHGKALRKGTSPKRRRGGKVMTRKRKAEEVAGK
ncbi:hypothetical protein POM88_008211 [Heracleum sosnowskyi]|uniref:Ubiquitin-like protease family profile domain-containing protein n=1 Tax=Heracleum sosnowskyi TaxID=360622 RepID=A0AAD8J6V0_9APIA|nr:hypothetical protein POM88_008211 [Heracleum sosnowskyi]